MMDSMDMLRLSIEDNPRGGAPIALAGLILAALAASPGRAFTRLQLLEEAFGFDYDGLERTVDVHVANLRKKLEPDASEPTYLLTVYGVGYKMNDQPA